MDTLAIFGSQGGSTYHVLGTPTSPTATTTLTCNGADTVIVGSNGSLAGLHSNLLIRNLGNFTDLTIDASADASPATPAIITNAAVTGLSVGAIEYVQSDLSALTIDGPQGGTTYDVLNLPAYSFLFPIITTLNARSGDTVNIGQHGSLQAPWANGSLVCNFAAGLAAPSRLSLDGSLDPAGAAYTIAGNNTLLVANSTVGLGVTINGFRSQDEVVINLPGGTVDADLTHTSAGTIIVNGSGRLTGVNPAAPLDITAHARAGAIVVQPAGANASLVQMFNTLNLLGTRPQDSLDVYDSDNNPAFSNDAIPAPFAQFAATLDDPTTVTAGQPFDFAVVAEDADGAPLTAYNSPVQWYAYNQATGEYVESEYESFPAADQGQHRFQGIALPEAGTYSLGFDDGWNVSSFTITSVASGGGQPNGQADGSGAPSKIAAGKNALQPAEVASDSAPSAPLVNTAAAVVASGPAAKVSRIGNTVVSTDVPRHPLPVLQTFAVHCPVDPRTNPGGSWGRVAFRSTQPVVVDHSSADAGATPSSKSASSESIGRAGAEPHAVHRAIASRIALIRSDSELALPSDSVWSDAVDECFAQYDSPANFFNHFTST